jgi:hypothetical protein
MNGAPYYYEKEKKMSTSATNIYYLEQFLYKIYFFSNKLIFHLNGIIISRYLPSVYCISLLLSILLFFLDANAKQPSHPWSPFHNFHFLHL